MPNLDYLLDSNSAKSRSRYNYIKEYPIGKYRSQETQKLEWNNDQNLITHLQQYNNLKADEYNFKLTKDDFKALVLSTAVTNYKRNNYHSYINLKLE